MPLYLPCPCPALTVFPRTLLLTALTPKSSPLMTLLTCPALCACLLFSPSCTHFVTQPFRSSATASRGLALRS